MAQRKTVRLGGKQLRVATKLAPATIAKRGYCPTCSGIGTHGKTKTGKARPCRRCNGTGRAATPATKPAAKTSAKKTAAAAPKPSSARTSGQTVAARRPAASGAGARTAYGAAANRRTADRKAKKATKKAPTVLRLFGIGGNRLPVNRAVRGWVRGAFGTRTTTVAQARARNNRSFGQTLAIGGNPGASWWRCPRCSASETGLRDADTATGRAAAHWAGTHPGAPFRLDPQGPNTTASRKG